MRARRLALRMLWIVVGTLVVFGAGAWAFQRRLIYFPERLEGEPGLDPGFPARVVTFEASDGVRITGLWAPPPDDRSAVVLLAHGNAGSIRTWVPALAEHVRAGRGGLLLDPRGYGWSEGSPSEAGWIRDGGAAWEWVRAQGIDEGRIVLHGVSIGGAIAVRLASEHRARGLVLESAFTSLVDVARTSFGFLPVGLLLRDRFDNRARAPRVACPVLVVHGEADEIVPVSQSRELSTAFPGTVTLHVVPGCGHNDLCHDPGRARALAEFLASLEATR